MLKLETKLRSSNQVFPSTSKNTEVLLKQSQVLKKCVPTKISHVVDIPVGPSVSFVKTDEYY